MKTRAFILGSMAICTIASSDIASARELAAADIVVTGRKIDADASRAPLSMDAIDADQLEGLGLRDPADLFKAVPGLNYTLSAYETPVFTIRGVGFYDSSLGAPPAVSMSIDEAPIPYPILAAGALMDLQQVEVLKGPQATLFGQNSTGGTINVVPAKPTDSLRFGGRLSAARFGLVQADGFVSGPLGQNVRARLALRTENGGAWQRSSSRKDELGDRDFHTGRLLIDAQASPNWRVELHLNGWIDQSDGQAGQFLGIILPPSRLPPALIAYTKSSSANHVADWDAGKAYQRDSRYWQAVLRNEFLLGTGVVTSISSYQRLERDDLHDADGTALTTLDVRTMGTIDVVAQELRYSGQVDQLGWILGGNFQKEWVNEDQIFTFPESSLPFDAVRPKASQHVETWALFGNLKYQLSEKLSLQGGARWTSETRRLTACAYDDGSGSAATYISRVASLLSGRTVLVAPGGCGSLNETFMPTLVRDVLRDRNWSWRLGIEYEFEPGTLIYANASRGHKSGTFPTLAATSTRQFSPARPESVLAFEGGVKLTLAQQAVRLSAAAFYYAYDDKQIRGKSIDPRLGALSMLINVPRSEVIGGEVEMTALPSRNLSVSFKASYVHSKILGPFVNYDGVGTLQELGGEAFPLTPAWQFAGTLDYQRRISGTLEAFAGAGLSYQDSTNAALGELPLLAMRDYVLLDFRGGIRTANGWEVSAFARNLLDEDYAAFVSTTSVDVAVRLAGRPRSYGLAIAYQF